MSKKQKILSDHRVIDKKLAPPFIQFLKEHNTEFTETSFITKVLPEIIWQAFLNEKYGVNVASQITERLLFEINLIRVSKQPPFCFISNFELLTAEEIKKINSRLASNSEFEKLKEGILPLVKVFPQCPLKSLFANQLEENLDSDLDFVKSVIRPLLDKTSRDATLMLANTFYLMFQLDILKVHPESSLLNLQQVEFYPKTEASKRVASAMRAGINVFLMNEQFVILQSGWTKYFWNRAYKLEPYNIDTLHF